MKFSPKNLPSVFRSILDYDINIYPLLPQDRSYTALNMNYSVAGFQLVLSRKASFYIVTYYLPSGLFVIVSWISFLINPEVLSVSLLTNLEELYSSHETTQEIKLKLKFQVKTQRT